MRTHHIISLAAMTAVLSLPSVVSAQDVHTIVPHFPDHFKVKTTGIVDQATEKQGQKQSMHSEVEVLADTQKQASGYHAAYTLVSLKMDTVGPDGQPTDQGKQMAAMATAVKSIGSAQVTLDDNLDPVSVDNIEDIKAKFKQMLTSSSDAQKVAAGQKVYDTLFAKMTPESAAAFLKMAKAQATVYNRPLVVGQAVPLSSTPMQFMGASFNLNATVTLTDWQEGKTAHLTMTMAPSEADLREFMRNLLGGMLNHTTATANQTDAQKAQTAEVMNRLMDNMKMHILSTCDVDVDLSNAINKHTVCTTATEISIDMRKILPDETLKAHPEAADKLPVVTVTQTSHADTTAALVN